MHARSHDPAGGSAGGHHSWHPDSTDPGRVCGWEKSPLPITIPRACLLRTISNIPSDGHVQNRLLHNSRSTLTSRLRARNLIFQQPTRTPPITLAVHLYLTADLGISVETERANNGHNIIKRHILQSDVSPPARDHVWTTANASLATDVHSRNVIPGLVKTLATTTGPLLWRGSFLWLCLCHNSTITRASLQSNGAKVLPAEQSAQCRGRWCYGGFRGLDDCLGQCV